MAGFNETFSDAMKEDEDYLQRTIRMIALKWARKDNPLESAFEVVETANIYWQFMATGVILSPEED